MSITAFSGDDVSLQQKLLFYRRWFIVDEEHFGQSDENAVQVPYPLNMQPTCKNIVKTQGYHFRTRDAE